MDLEAYKRVKPEEVLEAYRKTGFYPVQDSWGYLSTNLGKPCCCGITTYEINRANVTYEMWMNQYKGSPLPIDEYIGRQMNIPGSYVRGFSCGFDQVTAQDPDDEDYMKGHEDGMAAYQLVDKKILIWHA